MAERSFDITVNVDTRQADRSLNRFQRELQDTQQELQDVGQGAGRNLDRFNDTVQETGRNLNQIDSNVVDIRAAMGGLGAEFGSLSGEAGGLASSALEVAQTIGLAANSANDMAQAQALANNQFRNASGDIENMIPPTRIATRETSRLASTMTAARAALTSLPVVITAAAAAFGLLAAGMAKVVEQNSRLANLRTENFQMFSAATERFGINAEQAANIIKDFNDKVGDFIITGAGPLTDLMERLGTQTELTTEKLVTMSGPDALVAIKTAMDQANLSMQEQVFILESLGSDLTLLLPLLENNGKALREFGSEFDTIAAVVEKGSIATLVSLSNEWNDTINVTKKLFIELGALVAPLIELILAGLNKIIGLMGAVVGTLNSGIRSVTQNLLEWLVTFDALSDNETIKEWIAGLESLKFEVQDLTGNAKALAALQDQRAAKALKVGNDLINNQIDLAMAVGQSTAAYEQELFMQTRIAKQEAKRAELAKSGLRPEQIQAIIDKYDILEIAIQHTNDELSRRTAIEGFNSSLENQLELLRARNEEERRFIELNQQIGDTVLSPAERARLESLQAQIIAQEKLNQLLEDQKVAWQDLGSAVTSFALGSKAALAEVIKQLIILANLEFFGGNSAFLSSFAGGIRGFASGGQFNAGETFMVGEQGPEIITSSAPGTVIPNHQLGGGGGSNMSFSFNVGGSVNGVDDLDRRFNEFAVAIAENTNGLLRNQLRTGGVLA